MSYMLSGLSENIMQITINLKPELVAKTRKVTFDERTQSRTRSKDVSRYATFLKLRVTSLEFLDKLGVGTKHEGYSAGGIVIRLVIQ
jgi:hypothetical protein